MVGAAPVNETDWGVFLQSDGMLNVYPLKDLLQAGRLPGSEPTASILSFSTFHMPEAND
jgi:hypothetical protein